MLNDLIKRTMACLLEPFPGFVVKARYLLRFRRLPNLKHPGDLNEIILYLKLYSDTSRWTKLADKYKVRDYVAACGFADNLIPLYGAWSRVDDIPFDELPDTFMLKANNGDGKGTNTAIDKRKMADADWKALRRTLNEWLSAKHIGALSAEPQYRDIPPMIIAEKMLETPAGENSIIDYKLWCFNGKPHSFLVVSNRKGHAAQLSAYDIDWNKHPEWMEETKAYPADKRLLPRPVHLKEMIDMAATLSKPFPAVRVDMYEAEGKVYFGELTFTSLGGMMNYYTPEHLKEMGDVVVL